MKTVDFSNIAKQYEEYSLVQKSSADLLLDLLKIGGDDDVLDLGCGVGNLTNKIRNITKGKVVGVDVSSGMIDEAKVKNGHTDIEFRVLSVDNLDYDDCFDAIFCNSTFQWFKNPEKALKNCFKSLKKNGRMGIQATATSSYCPNFILAVEKVKNHEKTKDIFSHFSPPWLHLESSDEYKKLFEKAGFEVVLSKFETTKSEHSPQEVFQIFSSGAIIGYLGQDSYNCIIDEAYKEVFKSIVKSSFEEQGKNGKVSLLFNRIYLVAVKSNH